MIKTIASTAVLFSGICFVLLSENCTKQARPDARTRQVQHMVRHQIDTFCGYIDQDFLPEAAHAVPAEARLQHHFLKTRLLFKKFEWAAEYFMGYATSMINGPPVQEVENADLLDKALTRGLNPSGLQVIEEFLFPEYLPEEHENLLEQLGIIQLNCEALSNYFTNNTAEDWQVLDALKLEVFRVLTLGITGFDNPLTLKSSEESAAALKSVRDVLKLYNNTEETEDLLDLSRAAIQYLQHHTDFDSFDRAAFITQFGNPVSSGIAKIQDEFGYPLKYNRLLKQEAKTLFDEDAFNVNAFAPGPEAYYTDEKAKLGELLFFDANLSATGTRSCSTCHLPGKAFTDGLAKNTNIYKPDEDLPRNTPTLLNTALQSNFFYDMRALTLENQAHDVIHNPDEMDGFMPDIIAYLQQDENYSGRFAEAFPGRKEIDEFAVTNALGSYLRSLTLLNSRFDEYMRGNKNALTPQEIDGFNIFMGKAKCATCHFMPTFFGVQPPKYVESEAEVIGVPVSLADSTLDTDLGWYEIVGVDSYKHAFKTPTVRNVTNSEPYMHNGIYNTLEEVMEFYNNAGAVGLGFELENVTLPEDSLRLSDAEIDAVVAFMKSLDSVY